MSQIKIALVAVASLLALFLSGCGDVNSQAGFNSINGKHVAGWLPDGHKNTARANIDSCTACHGQDLAGGIVKVTCTRCHIGNVDLEQNIHPANWGTFAYANHKGYVATNGNSSCANASCHGTTLQGVTNSGPSCAINCHMAGTVQTPQKHAWDSTNNTTGHIAYFVAEKAKNSNAGKFNYDTCRNNACHGGAGTTNPPPGVFWSGPACLSCHTATGSGVGNPLPAEVR